MGPLLFFLAALTVREGQTPLRSGCAAGDAVIANLAAGTPVEIRFRLADGGDCIKVAASVDNKDVVGYVSGSALAGLDGFEQERSSARTTDPTAALTPMEAEARRMVIQTGDPKLDRASQLLASNQPEQALDVLRPERYRKDANVLLLAGLAAYRMDRLDSALDYWKQSLELAPNDSLTQIYARVKREAESGRAGERLLGMHIALRYERETISVETARAILGTLDAEYSRISAQMGCSTRERIVAVVEDRDTYLRSTGAAEWSGGWYDGRIHMAWTGEKEVGPQMRRGLAHELVHACLTSIPAGATPWPAWLQEGLAQKLSGDQLAPQTREQLRQRAQAHQVPRLEELHPDWSRLSAEQARTAYSLALAAADALYDGDPNGLRNILRNPQSLGQVTADLDKKLGF
ncbi:MAG: tetratricopeptide repeat protein [Acidobacteriia bacterium]|nr:tetratricopeptide repeat protein [Terriglobia bacterium]